MEETTNDDKHNVENVLMELMSYIQSDQGDRAIHVLKKISQEDRSSVARAVDDEGRTLLFNAVSLGHTALVSFLLDECSADIEQRCDYIDKKRFLLLWDVTPLTCAVNTSQREVVKTLLEHGADVNAGSCEDRMTPLYAACFNRDIDVAKLLVEKGADIHLSGMYGETLCLMASVRSTELCQFLIQQGALINAVDERGDSAINSAIKRGGFESVKLLMEHGADPNIRNNDGDDALQLAAIKCLPEVMNYLIEKTKPTPQRRADLYSLLGAKIVVDDSAPQQALPYWIKAANIRMEELTDEEEAGEAVCAGPNAVYNCAVEVKDVDALVNIAADTDAMLMQALVKRERILGLHHPETMAGISIIADRYDEIGAFQRSVDLWKYVLVNDNSMTWLTLLQMHRIFFAMFRLNATSIRFFDVFDVLQSAKDKLRFLVKFSADEGYLEGSLITSLLGLSCCLTLTEAETANFQQLVRALLKFRFADGMTLLHLAASVEYVERTEEHKPPSVEGDDRTGITPSGVVQCLLAAGAAADEVDSDGDTPLHYALVNQDTDKEETDKIIQLLLNHGAHIDQANAAGEAASDYLPDEVAFNHLSLKCLAARAVRTYKLEYRGTVPDKLADFVDMHSAQSKPVLLSKPKDNDV